MNLPAADIRISDYSYTLPEDRIAVYPLQKRDESKLLLFKDGLCRDYRFYDIAELLPANSLLVVNNTRVIHARLIFQKPNTGARIEIFCLEPEALDYNSAFMPGSKSKWKCLIGNSKRWKAGKLSLSIPTGEKNILFEAECLSREDGYGWVEFTWNAPEMSFGEVLDLAGKLPIPPYLGRESEASDEENYQTLYASQEGSVAAPTAGLHFTPAVLESLGKHNIRTEELTLHVGAGTFLPVKAETMAGHEMHRESVSVRTELLEQLKMYLDKKLPVGAVGTTSLRTLESLYWFGTHPALMQQENILPAVDQWMAYLHADRQITAAEAIDNLLQYARERKLDSIQGSTQLMIAPGYTFRMVSHLITNFHQPNSTLLLLVAAFTQGRWKQVYEHALQHEYRFLSFGDSSLLFREHN